MRSIPKTVPCKSSKKLLFVWWRDRAVSCLYVHVGVNDVLDPCGVSLEWTASLRILYSQSMGRKLSCYFNTKESVLLIVRALHVIKMHDRGDPSFESFAWTLVLTQRQFCNSYFEIVEYEKKNKILYCSSHIGPIQMWDMKLQVIEDYIRAPEVAFTGDTTIEFLESPIADQILNAKLLIIIDCTWWPA